MISDTSYSSHSFAPNSAMPRQQKVSTSAEDTEEIASFLLSLKHRSVTPEPSVVDETNSIQPTCGGAHYFTPVHDTQPCVDKTPATMMQEQQHHASVSGEVPVEALLNGSKLVLTKDRDLVPDALFVAMAQMRPCKLTQADRVGCYKSREIGFLGLCCIHCGGQPGFGRYYPNSVRSLAQTTTSQTILKHVGNKCRFCPPHIRNAVNELQRQQAAREGMSSGRPRYGSRKIFFQRVWARLHGGPLPEEDDQTTKTTPAPSLADDVSNQTPSDLESESNSRNSSPATSDDEDSLVYSSKRAAGAGHGFLPLKKKLKRSFEAAQAFEASRFHGFSN